MAEITKSIPAVSALIEKSVLTLKFADNRTLVLDCATLSADLREYAMMDRFRSKLVDSTALSKGASLDDKFEAAAAVHANLLAGNWTAPKGDRETGTLLVRALMHLDTAGAKTRVEWTEWLNAMTKEQIADLRMNPRVVAALAAVRPKPTEEIVKKADDLLNAFLAPKPIVPEVVEKPAAEVKAMKKANAERVKALKV